jgi:hypothetical protein
MTKRGGGHETWHRLSSWTAGQAQAERLAAQILHVEGFKSLDPIHPLGGKDGVKDIVCEYNGKQYIGAAYFPNGQMRFADLKKKFEDDLKGVKKNNVDGIAFITNQAIPQADRKTLKKLAGDASVEIFHLERINRILDSPQCYGIRLEYLDIDVSKEELSALLAENRATLEKNHQLLEENRGLANDLKTVSERMLKVVENPNFLRAEETINQIQILKAIRFLLEDPNAGNISTYRSLVVYIQGSLDIAIPILIKSVTFEDYVERATGNKPIIKELPHDLSLARDNLILISHSTAYPPAIEAGSDAHMITVLTKDKQMELNQVAFNAYSYTHGKLLEAVTATS